MNWKKITEQVITVVLSMVLTGFGGATVWAISTILTQQREQAIQAAKIIILEENLKAAQERDKVAVTLMAEEIKKMKKAVEEALAEHGKPDKVKVPFTGPIEVPKTDPKKTFDKFFPPEQRTEDYQRILRDKLDERTKNRMQEQIRQ